MIQAGSSVLCVHDRFSMLVFKYGSALPKKGCIYTVRRLVTARDGKTGIMGPGLVLCELSNPLPAGGDLAFSVWRFEEVPSGGRSMMRPCRSRALPWQRLCREASFLLCV